MPTMDTGSTVPRRQLGRELRKLREEAAVTVGAAAAALEWSGPKLWRIESGLTAVRVVDVRAMCELYGADGPTTEALAALARETRAKGWWHAYGDTIPAYFELYMGLEAAASKLRTYDPELVHGLLQTREYAAEVFRVGNPDWSEEEVERAVALRLRRQKLLRRPAPGPLVLDAVLNEAVLWRAPGAQLRHVAALSRRPNVTVRVLPFRAGIHPAAMASGSFTILDFPVTGRRAPEPTTVYCADGLTGALYLDQPKEIDTYNMIWEGTVAACLPPADSRAYIEKIAEERS